jgi:hypothetical protein
VTGSAGGPALPAGEVQAAESLLTSAWGEPVVVQAAEKIWGRSHVVRLRLDTGRVVVLKRRYRPGRRRGRGFGVELAALEYLNAMPVPVAPCLLGADAEAEALEQDHEWGTTTMRPRFLAWLRSFTSRPGGGALPRLQRTASAMQERLAERWPGLRIPDYPALAQAGSALARVPDGWQPGP